MKAYYDRRAPEYDEWYLELGRFDGLDESAGMLAIARERVPAASFVEADAALAGLPLFDDGSRWTVYNVQSIE